MCYFVYNACIHISYESYHAFILFWDSFHQTSKLRVVGSSPTVGKNFSFCILSLSTRS